MPTLKLGLLLAVLALGTVFTPGPLLRVAEACNQCGFDHTGPCAHGVSADGDASGSHWHTHNGEPAVGAFQLTSRWSGGSQGSFSGSGTPATLTWGFVREGTNIPQATGVPGDAAGPSNLIAFLDGIFGDTTIPGQTDQSGKSWFPLVESAYDRWESISGVDFEYEPNDSGSYFAGGLNGVRADMRVGGRRINGPGGTLAYNYFPSFGDMVIDTTDTNFYSNASGNYLRLRNVIMHELGHGLGIEHVIANGTRQLMEPTINTNFEGPQIDDIQAIQRHYGDALEKNGGNDVMATATDGGSLGLFSGWAIGTDADFTVANTEIFMDQTDFVSIDNSSDTDYYRFTATDSGLFDVRLKPVGPTYTEAAQPNPGQPSFPQVSFAASEQSRLNFVVFDSNGTPIASSQAASLGDELEFADIAVTEGQEYFVRVRGSENSLQLYRLDAALNAAPNAGTDFDLASLPFLQGQQSVTTTADDVTLTIEAMGASPTLDTDGQGVGVVSTGDGAVTNNDRQVNGAYATPEKLLLSFDKPVALENLEITGLSTGGDEGVRLSLVSGANPFTGLSGYTGPYTIDATGIEFTSPDWQSELINLAFGIDGQSRLLIEAGTVLALTSVNPIDGGIGLAGLTINAVPEPSAWLLMLVAGAGLRRRQRAAA